MFQIVFIAIWVFIPAGLANMAPVFASKIPALTFLDIPLDFGKKLRGRRVFGDNKTLRGFVAGFVFALGGVLLQRWLWEHVGQPCFQCGIEGNYSIKLITSNVLLVSLLYSFGALGGDAIESFFKRQVGKSSGSAWFPFDQLDYIVGGLLLTWPVVHYSASLAGTVLITFFVLHIVSTIIGYGLGLKDAPI
jgi:CDP-2,3-bis-(O-geranylgeranyl)-sn-glycerol synthase